MPRGRSITLEQEDKVLALYELGVSIKEIIKETGVKSEQTIYRILDDNNVPRRPKLKVAGRVLITVEEEVAEMLKKQKNVSRYVNEAIRYFDKNA